MPASVPDSVMLDAVTVFVLPIAFVPKVAVPLTVNASPVMRSSAYVTLAVLLPSYCLLVAVIVTANALAVMLDVAVGAPVNDKL